MQTQTKSQRLAQKAYERVEQRKNESSGQLPAEYVSFAKKFPALIHTCGLMQAVAFAIAKGRSSRTNAGGETPQNKVEPEFKYLEDLVRVLQVTGHDTIHTPEDLEKRCRETYVPHYIRLSRDALTAASWLKRYVEAFQEA